MSDCNGYRILSGYSEQYKTLPGISWKKMECVKDNTEEHAVHSKNKNIRDLYRDLRMVTNIELTT
jgi:hypothetical protein